jgi:hypothetical protein
MRIYDVEGMAPFLAILECLDKAAAASDRRNGVPLLAV